jgi:hypothetical protein
MSRKTNRMYSFSVPNAVTDLLVYTKNESSASLRWKPPYPPTGVLEKYKIDCQNGYYFVDKHINEFEMTSCKLWPDFHCVTVSNLKSGVGYTCNVCNLKLLEEVVYFNIIINAQVNAKNEDVSEFGPENSTHTKTEIGRH